MTESDGTISFDVTVTNTGDVAGKDVVEVFYNPSYTKGGIEKSVSNLVAFEKTDMLEPGDSQTESIRFPPELLGANQMIYKNYVMPFINNKGIEYLYFDKNQKKQPVKELISHILFLKSQYLLCATDRPTEFIEADKCSVTINA